MGATRRLDHYDASIGWQGLFIVAGLGVMLICLGIAFQLLQIVVSVIKRKKNLDTTGDPWNGRTLEWATTSPPPEYNFALIPTVIDRDAFLALKQKRPQGAKLPYQDIVIPKNTSIGVFIAAFAFMVGFGAIWHIVWLAVVGIAGVIISLVIRLSNDDTEQTLKASEISKIEDKGYLA